MSRRLLQLIWRKKEKANRSITLSSRFPKQQQLFVGTFSFVDEMDCCPKKDSLLSPKKGCGYLLQKKNNNKTWRRSTFVWCSERTCKKCGKFTFSEWHLNRVATWTFQKPRGTPEELQRQVRSVLKDFRVFMLESPLQPNMKCKTSFTKVQGGCTVVISWRAPDTEWCHCKSDDCEEYHSFSFRQVTYQVTSDLLLCYFKSEAIPNEKQFFESISPLR